MPATEQKANYIGRKTLDTLPRLPVEGYLDITYRCNNNCRHCWLRIPPNAQEREKELSLEEIKHIVNEAKQMGCRSWFISGGEPMLRSDFPEIFDYITSHFNTYSLNTNGTLITPEIAQLLRRKGFNTVALYGATATVHDHITRNPGSFEATMRGCAYLREAGAGFVVQLIPMRDNYHQFQDMVRLAESLSPAYKIGASWLYLSACGDAEINREIKYQRLDPKAVIDIDQPSMSSEDFMAERSSHIYCNFKEDDRLFARCISKRSDFNIDPYGQMTFCSLVKDPDLRYDLRKGDFKECWERFIPSLADKVRGGSEYSENCASCEFRKECRWCPVYSYLEHRRFSAKIEYLCDIAKEARKFKENWEKERRRYFRIADITIRVDSDIPITDSTFAPEFKEFEVDGPGEDNVTLRHHFSLPDIRDENNFGERVYRKKPWMIYKKGDSWIYVAISSKARIRQFQQVAVFNQDYTRARIYNSSEKIFLRGNSDSLSLLSSDQIFLAHLLADRSGCYLHASGVSMNGKGFLFVGHSESGKSTMAKILKAKAEILCDDRVIVRKNLQGFTIYGTWSHGELPYVSKDCAPLKAILFLNKSEKNYLEPLEGRKEIIAKLLAYLIKPFVTTLWWEKMFSLLEKIASDVPCYSLYFDKSGRVCDLLERL